MPFKRPSAAATAAALGPMDATSVPDAAARRALDARLDPDAFSRVPRVRRGDWLSEHEERGQSLKSYQRRSYRTEPHAYFTTCYMVPYGKFPPGCSPELTALADIAAAFFGFPVVCTKPVRLREVSHGSRVGASGQTQLLLSDVYDHLRRVKLPRDAFARIAVTMTDLYPGEEWNFVYGQAVMTDGIGAYSFARFGPDEVFMGEGAAPAHTELSAADKTLLLRRSAKVLLHETTHVLGMRHCIYYKCLMNGTNHLDEFDAKPLHLCPVCLRKLMDVCHIDVTRRFLALEKLFDKHGLVDDAAWVRTTTTAPAAHRQQARAAVPALEVVVCKRQGE